MTSAMVAGAAARWSSSLCGGKKALAEDEPVFVNRGGAPVLLGARGGAGEKKPKAVTASPEVVEILAPVAEAVPAADDGAIAAEAAPKEAAAAEEAPASWAPDAAVLARVRHLAANEAHCRAVAALDAYRAGLVEEGVAEAFDAFCAGDEEIRRLRFKVDTIQRCEAHLRYAAPGADGEQLEGSPAHHVLGNGSELWVDHYSDNTVDYRVCAPFDIPMDHMLSLFYEVDLYPKWLPFVWESKILHMVKGGSGDYAQFLVVFKYVLPWPLKNREAVLYGFASDAIERGRVVLCSKSVPEGATEWWGYPLPPAGDAVRMDVVMDFGFVPQGPELDKTRLDIFFKLDPKIDWLPQGFVNWVGRQFVTLLYRGISSICRNFAKSPYPARLSADVNDAYAVMYRMLMAMRGGTLPEDAAETSV